MSDGWISIHRKLLKNPIVWDIYEPFDSRSAWIDLLLSCQYKDTTIKTKYGDLISLKAGQSYTSTMFLAEHWKWSRNRVNRFLKTLQTAGMITYNSSAHGTVITIANWASYQIWSSAGETASGTTWETAGETTGETADGTLTINKQVNNVNKGTKKINARAREGSLSSRYNVNTEGLKRVIEE